MSRLERILARTESLLRIFSIIAIVAVWFLFLLIFTDVACRSLLGFSVVGTVEISSYLVVAVCFLPLGYTQITGGHVSVETVLSRLPAGARSILNTLFLLLSMGMFLLIAWQTGLGAYTYWQRGAVHYGAIKLPYWIPMFLASLGSSLLVVTFLTQVLRNITAARRGWG